MPWKELRVVHERLRFVAACDESEASFAELCRRFGVSRKTGYKWIERYEQLGPKGLEDLPPIARHSPHRTADEVADALVKARKDHPTWGPKKLRAWLGERAPELALPAPSTIGDILKQRGLVRPRRRRLRVPINPLPLADCSGSNAVWCADFKGHFGLGDRSRCHPLTMTDGYSRYLLKCEALAEPKSGPAREHFELAFREFGMPAKIRTDNGPPFASVGLGGLSELSVWWIKLGIEPERIDPGRPDQNGRHERMHRTLKDEATSPAAATLIEQQRVFDRFRHEYNDERPHEALGQKPPTRFYVTSARSYPATLREPEYGPEFTVRRVDGRGRFRRKGIHVPLSTCIANEAVGLKPIDDGRWELFYGPVRLGVLDETGDAPRVLRAG